MTLTLIFVIFGAVVFIGVALGILVHLDRSRRHREARLRRLRADAEIMVTSSKRKSPPKTNTDGLFTDIEQQLERTNLRVNVTELVGQVFVGVLASYALLVLLLGLNPLLALPIAVGVPVSLATLVLRVAKARYLAAFTVTLPEALDVFARGLRAGRPVSDSLSIVVETTSGSVQREFSRCHDEICLGASLPDSLKRLEQRVPTPDVSFFAVATSLQAETGGNLIETMEGLAGQLRERRKLRKKARALSSEARASAVILAALPFAVAMILAVLNAAYLAPLINDPRGQVMSVAAFSSIALGVFIMARMGKLDV